MQVSNLEMKWQRRATSLSSASRSRSLSRVILFAHSSHRVSGTQAWLRKSTFARTSLYSCRLERSIIVSTMSRAIWWSSSCLPMWALATSFLTSWVTCAILGTVSNLKALQFKFWKAQTPRLQYCTKTPQFQSASIQDRSLTPPSRLTQHELRQSQSLHSDSLWLIQFKREASSMLAFLWVTSKSQTRSVKAAWEWMAVLGSRQIRPFGSPASDLVFHPKAFKLRISLS